MLVFKCLRGPRPKGVSRLHHMEGRAVSNHQQSISIRKKFKKNAFKSHWPSIQ